MLVEVAWRAAETPGVSVEVGWRDGEGPGMLVEVAWRAAESPARKRAVYADEARCRGLDWEVSALCDVAREQGGALARRM